MAQRRFHYEQAFEHYLRSNRIPYVAVDEAKKTLLPQGDEPPDIPRSLKSFDFVIYTESRNLLIDVKGRMYGSARTRHGAPTTVITGGRRLESWVTTDDVESLRHWQKLFGSGFEAVFVFMYCLRRQPPDALFEEVLSFGDRWYALREVTLADYCREMVPRSSSWQTVHVPSDCWGRISRPFSARRMSPDAVGCDSRARSNEHSCGSATAAVC